MICDKKSMTIEERKRAAAALKAHRRWERLLASSSEYRPSTWERYWARVSAVQAANLAHATDKMILGG